METVFNGSIVEDQVIKNGLIADDADTDCDITETDMVDPLDNFNGGQR